MPEKPIPVGIIGLGHIGKIHIEAILQFNEIQLVAVCDRQKDFAELAPKGVTFYSDFEDLLNDKRIETVIIATPNQTHYDVASKALSAGKNLILEKPAADSMSELRFLAKTASSKGLSIYYAFHAACAYDVTWTVNYLNDSEVKGELGNLTGFSCRFYDPYILNGALKEEAEGLQNCWIDSGINAISVIQRFVPLESIVIENVSASSSEVSESSILQCMAEYRFSIFHTDLSGVGTIDTNWASGRNYKSTTLYFGESGNAITMDHSTQKVFRWYTDGNKHELANLSGGFDRLYNHYLGVFTNYLQYIDSEKTKNRMNSKESFAAHELLFRTESAINHPLGNS